MMSTGKEYQVDGVGYFMPKKINADFLQAGDVGFINAQIKNLTDCKVGDTITLTQFADSIKPLSGFEQNKPVVFCGIYPVDSSEFEKFRDSIAKLHLNDASFEYETETSSALGYGFRCGFLGLLHLEIIQERLEREYNLDIITTAPSVVYKIHLRSKRKAGLPDMLEVHSPESMPDPTHIDYMEEPWIKATIITPEEFLGSVIDLCISKRGIQKELNFVDSSRVMLNYELPLNEVIYDFYDKLKSCSKGYASFDWEIDRYEKSDLCKLSILVNGESVDSLSLIVHKSRSESRGRGIMPKIKRAHSKTDVCHCYSSCHWR